tara:strand:+ start:477 stop:767 length:291 start_codon:yes stop_codon:yes gene_type:complete
MKTKTNNKKFICIVKVWLDKINGNTYHNAKLFINNNIIETGLTYGYGNQYEQSIYNKYNMVESWNKNPFKYASKKLFLDTIHFEVIQVNTKKELNK